MAGGKQGKPSLPQDEADRVVAAMVRLLEERYENNKTRLAEALGISQPAVSGLLPPFQKNRPSVQTAAAVAHLLGVSEEDLRKGRAMLRLVTLEERYPNRQRAVRAARELRYDERAIAEVELMQLQSNEDPEPDWWLERIKERHVRLRDPFLAAPPGRAPDDDV